MVVLSGIDGKAITLLVQRQNEKEVYYRMGMNMSLKYLMNDYYKRMGLGLGTIQFIGPDGNLLRENNTPLQLKLEDGDVIDAFSHVDGG
ncbi:hypothetical protein Lalb_Chr19g0125601 [Lupinus albus]|uniref:Ubiquitin-like domain-containing protein n=1 Tax=Lupinus albus TaxID=3870 RepID=A0A6A4NWC0_LUPAL|nr:hypothetical protein Lalb_Chr19g0125601 [Lupinus albus]